MVEPPPSSPASARTRAQAPPRLATLGIRCALAASALLLLGAAPQLDDSEAADEQFFVQTVAPILERACFECHGPDAPEAKGGLRMTGTTALLLGGDSGPAIVPGDPDASRLVRAVRWTSRDLEMPPTGRLPPADVAALERWIGAGALWPGSASGTTAADDPTDPASDHAPPRTEAAIGDGVDRDWWAFRPVERPPVPALPSGATAPNAIDAFVMARLADAGLLPGAAADPRQLVRRAWLDLTGLPPTYAEVEAAVADSAADAWERLVDRLLDSPRYGERWGRHWLDVVRYAQTNGYEEDGEKPFAWRYRDYVVRAFNEDKPYDLFLSEQLAGDEFDEVTNDGLVATGLFHLGVWDAEPDDRLQAGYDVLDDSLRVISEGMLGVTLGCARCHDHKFDPFPQQDYYGLLALLRGLRPFEQPVAYALDSPALTPLDFSPEVALRWETQRWERIRAISDQIELEADETREQIISERLADMPPETVAAYRTPSKRRSPVQRELVRQADMLITDQDVNRGMGSRFYMLRQEALDTKTSFRGALDWALTAREASARPPPTQMLVRGLASTPGPEVEPHFVAALCASDAATRPTIPLPPGGTSGRRRALAEWITDPSHPTTARVLVNRVWLHHFGRGLVATPDDFGRQGALPTHPELLDWLAAEFVANGWSIKHLHRLIMSSAVYRRASVVDDPRALLVDPGNQLLWRQNGRRLDAESIRDSALAVSGELRHGDGGRGFFPRLGRQALARSSRPGEGWDLSTPEQCNQRSIHAFAKRSMVDPLLEVFDLCSSALPVGARLTTTLPSQALATLNGDFMNRQAAALARRVQREAGDDLDARITRLFELALSRQPGDDERAILADQLRQQADAFAAQRPSLVFRQEVPARLDETYLDELDAEDVLFGPRRQWSYLRGAWGTPYNSTVELDRTRGPAALLQAPVFADGELTLGMRLHKGCDFAALLLRADPDGEQVTGVELRFDPAAKLVELVLHDGGGSVILARRDAALTFGAWHELRVELEGPRVTLWIDGAPRPVLDVEHPDLLGSGRFGVRTWGEALQLADLTISANGRTVAVPPDDIGTPDDLALAAAALLMLNLDEFVHVD